MPCVPVTTSIYSLLNKYIYNETVNIRAQEVCESRGGRPGLPVSSSLYGLCGPKATVDEEEEEDDDDYERQSR